MRAVCGERLPLLGHGDLFSQRLPLHVRLAGAIGTEEAVCLTKKKKELLMSAISFLPWGNHDSHCICDYKTKKKLRK